MKKYFSGVVTGCIIGLILATTTFAFGADPIKLMVNGRLISFPDAPPQIVNGRTMVPARPLAEALGANVAWDDANRTVVVTGGVYTDGTPTDLPAVGQPGKAVDEPSSPVNPPQTVPTDMISLRDLHDIHGAVITVGGKSGDMTIELRTAKITVSSTQLTELRDKGIILVDVIVTGNVVEQVSIKYIKSQTHIDKRFLEIAQ